MHPTLSLDSVEMKERHSSELLSQLWHFPIFLIRRSRTQFEKASLIISVDVDVGSKELGLLNKGQNDKNVSSNLTEYSVGEIEQRVFFRFVNLFEDFEVPVTFAIRGQLLEVDSTIVDFIRDSPVNHDIGAHGYYHRSFTGLSRNEAEEELGRLHVEMKRFNIIPKSFVFPRNHVAHLDLLMKYGYKCYRGTGSLLDACMRIEKQGVLFNIYPSLYVSQSLNSYILKKTLDISIARRLPFHLWFHLWTFGQEDKCVQKNINKILIPTLDYARRKERMGMLTFETMLSAAKKAEKYFDL